MKTNKLKSLFLLGTLIFIVSLTACKKNPVDNPTDFLPPETQTGKDTFGCLVNGKLLLPKGGSKPGLLSQKSINSSDFLIAVTDLDATRGRQFLRLNLIKSVDDQFSVTCVAYQQATVESEIKICPPTNYQLNITRYDEKNRILSGNFNVKIPATASNAEVNITDGRFDVTF